MQLKLPLDGHTDARQEKTRSIILLSGEIPMSTRSIVRAAIFAASLSTLTLAGCATASYAVLEQFGVEKRDVLIDKVIDVAEAQGEAKEEFADALEAFRAVVNVDGGDLEKTYDRLKNAYDDAEDRANAVNNRIGEMKRVSSDLFREWEGELGEYSDPSLRRASEDQLRATRARYKTLVEKMDAAADTMPPVLTAFNDRVLFLKHNLNARAIASLSGETTALESNVSQLIADMERSIEEADAFIQEMKAGTV